MADRASQQLRSSVASFARRWRRELEVVRRHPLRAPTDPPYRRAGIVYFFLVGVACLALLVVLASTSSLDAPFFLPFVVVAIATGLAEIRVHAERQVILNDLFFIVPFVFFPVGASAAMLIVLAVTDPLLHPRTLVRTMARLSSILTMRLAGLAGVLVGGELVPEGHWWSYAAIALCGLAGLRVNDYLLFPISLRLGIGEGFSWREYVLETARDDPLFLGLEVPLTAIAATAFPHAPWLVVGLAIPYFAAWRLALLRPAVDALREADELKSKFLSMASHELRTPLTSIAGFSSTLLHRWEQIPDDQRRELVGVIETQSTRLSRMIDQLLTMSRIEAGALVTHVKEVDLRPVLARAAEGVGHPEIVVDAPSDLRVVADPDHLEQIVINFLGNALKYGSAPVRVEACRRDGSRIEVRVVDHGPGVPEAFRPRMYEQFAQASTGDGRSARGTGLGLSIVQRLAQAQDAELDYEQVEPTGACFIVRLPAASPEQ